MFKVYVKGINPDKLDEVEVIREKVKNKFNVDADVIEQLLFPGDKPLQVEENISEQGAIELCKTLNDLGLVGIYEPIKTNRWSDLSLVPIENKSEVFTCPACKKQHPLVNHQDPEKCPSCKIDIAKYKLEQEKKKEYQEMREKMLRQKQASQKLEEEEKRSELEKQRKQQLEAEIAQELGLKKSKPLIPLAKPSQNQSLVLGVLLVFLLSGLAIYKLLPNKSGDDKLAETIPETNNQGQNQTVAVAGNQVQAEIPGQMDIEEAGMQAGQTPSQAALAKAHSDVSKFMDKMGIKTLDTTTASANQDPKTVTTQSTANSPSGSKGAKASSETTTIANSRIFLDTIYQDSHSNDIEWDWFLAKQAKSLIKSGKLKSAYKLSQAQTSMGDHIETIAELVGNFSKLGLGNLADSALEKLNQRIAAQPEELQAQFKAHLGATLQNQGKQTSLLSDAEAAATKIADPFKQSFALRKVAVAQKMAGNSQAADKLFTQAESIIKQATPGIDQFNAYLGLVHDYSELGFRINSQLALSQTAQALSAIDASKQQEAMSSLLAVAYEVNDPLLIKRLTDAIQTPAYRSKAIYKSMQAQLRHQDNLSLAPSPVSNITEHDYAAVGNAMAALTEPNPTKQKELVAAAQQQLLLINDHENKAVASSKVAKFLSRMGNSSESTTLFDRAFDSVNTISDINQKDAALFNLATDAGSSFLFDGANKFANLIKNEELKKAAMEIIQNHQRVKDLI